MIKIFVMTGLSEMSEISGMNLMTRISDLGEMTDSRVSRKPRYEYFA